MALESQGLHIFFQFTKQHRSHAKEQSFFEQRINNERDQPLDH